MMNSILEFLDVACIPSTNRKIFAKQLEDLLEELIGDHCDILLCDLGNLHGESEISCFAGTLLRKIATHFAQKVHVVVVHSDSLEKAN